MHKAGQRHLGAAIGLTEFIAAYLNGKLPPGQHRCTALLRLLLLNPMQSMLPLSLGYYIAGPSYSTLCLKPVNICSC